MRRFSSDAGITLILFIFYFPLSERFFSSSGRDPTAYRPTAVFMLSKCSCADWKIRKLGSESLSCRHKTLWSQNYDYKIERPNRYARGGMGIKKVLRDGFKGTSFKVWRQTTIFDFELCIRLRLLQHYGITCSLYI
jgi:hypothetical protein